MPYTQELCRILKSTPLSATVCDLILEAPRIAKLAAPGQFVNVKCDSFTLRRPISLAEIDAEAGRLRLICENRGKGTAWLNECKPGDVLNLVGPLGHGFPLPEQAQMIVLVGGGIGCPPLLPIARRYGKNATVITGFRTESMVILQQDFADTGADVRLCTDDGSAGFHGFTTQMLEQVLSEGRADMVCTCGPKVMMRRIAAIAEAMQIPCYVSMEERMACGIGACLGCTCHTKDKETGAPTQSRVCLNGPVFLSQEVDWE